jgi:hypothetical protein
MTYQYVSAVTRATRQDADWVATDLSQVQINDILNNYYQVSILLNNQFDPSPDYLTTDLLRSQAPMSIPSPTLAAWLASLGNAALTTSSLAPSTKTVPVRYADAWQAGYSANLSSIARSPSSSVTPSALDDLLLTKPGLDMSSMGNYLLATVNGYLHRCVGSVDGLYVIGGGISNRISGNNHVGLLSFLPVGKVLQIPITPEMIYKPNSTLKYSQSVWVKLPVSMTGKVVLLSIGGYLHVLDGTYVKTGDTTLKINFRMLPFPERIYQSLKSMDLSSLQLETGRSDSDQFAVASIYSDSVIQAYLSLSQSFAILVDAQDFYVRRQFLETSSMPGRYFGGVGSRFPLMGPLGRLWDYRLSKEEDTYVYGCEPMHDTHYLFQTTDYLNDLSIGPNRVPARPFSNGQGTLLEMGSYG